jgi:spermidine/putrescine transport system permease protein
MYPVAYFIARKVPLARRTKIILLFLLPFWTGDIVRNFAIMILLGNRGAINLILLNLGVIDRPLSLLFNNFSLSLGVFYSSSIFMLLPLYSAIEKLPKSLHEAASDLGAGSIDRFFNITLPLTRDGVVSACVLSFLINVGSYATPLMLSGPENRLFSQIIAYYFSTTEGQWNIGAAYAVILSLTALLTAAFIMWLGGSRRRVR